MYRTAQTQQSKRVRVACVTCNITRECERAVSSHALLTRELKLASVKLENAREYSQTNSPVITISRQGRTQKYERGFPNAKAKFG